MATNEQPTRSYKQFYGESAIKERGARMNDKLIIFPVQGRRRTQVLNRTRFHISLGYSGLRYNADLFQLPGVDSEKGDFELILCSGQETGVVDERGRYLLRSLGKVPFRLNGVYSFESFIERGDNLVIGYNKISVEDPDQTCENSTFSEKSLASSSLNTLIIGETGVGKSRLARSIYDEGNFVGNFVHVNLSAFSASLVESELFGHKKGSFTGATHDKRGAFLEANRGLLFLDEIDSLSIALQTKLLLFLDNKEVRPVGGHQTEKVDLKIVFAAGQDLKKLVKEGKMRRDFYYRVSSGMVVSIKPLRDEKDKITNICQNFCKTHGLYITSSLLELYRSYSWPGNIRQLIGHLEKKKACMKGRKIDHDMLDDVLFSEDEFIPMESRCGFSSLKEIKKSYAKKVYFELGRNIQQASNILEISPNTLRSLVAV